MRLTHAKIKIEAPDLIFLGFFFFLTMLHTACGILVPQSGIKPTPPELEVWNLNHWDHQGSPQDLNA